MNKILKNRITFGVSAGIIILACIFLIKACGGRKQHVSVETAAVRIGSVSSVITATGTIEAIKTVEVGTQVSGEVRKIYVDYNTQVKAGQLLAELDRRPLATTLTIAEAALDDAKSEMTYQTANFTRIKALYDKKLVAESDYDLALYNYERAKTSLKTSQLNYDKAKINLAYAYIYSPIDGVVLSRSVDEGQTVAASFSTPTLFSIANDLTRMQVEASIDEADIGQVKNGQRVDFTVDAYPDQKFSGTVTQIRLEPVVTSNVVTYTVIVEAPNPDKKLMPGMTANITVYVEEASDVLTISSKALRFKPNPLLLKAYFESLPDDMKPDSIPMPDQTPGTGNSPGKDFAFPSGVSEGQRPVPTQGAFPGFSPGAGSAGKGFPHLAATGNTGEQKPEVWLKTGALLHPVRIKTGIDNDVDVQVISGLKEGDEVVISMSLDKAVSSNTTSEEGTSSPFMPKPPSRRTKSN